MTFDSTAIRRLLAPLFALLLLSACVPAVRAPEQPAPPPGQPQPPVTEPVPTNAAMAGVRPGPVISSLSIAPANAVISLRAFRISCPSLLRRTDASGLAQDADWTTACSAAASWPDNDAWRFFTTYFETAIVGDGKAFATGYFEPEIAGSRTRRPGYDTPIYRTPPDLLTANPVTGERGRGRVNESGDYVLYYERAEIEDGAVAGRGLELAWAEDPIDLFFLEIQGSGRLKLPDGSVMRIGYANQNGREYIPVGRIMRERGILQPGGTSMQHIVAWLRANPVEAREIMRTNKSYIFFQELTGPGPLGALGLPVTGRATVAADPMFVPLGAPVILTGMETPIANGLWIAQDTGGAIKGSNRFDTFWGAGEEAARVAGGMAARGAAYILLPKGTVARLNANGSSAQR
jgi:membrane-bound lytic murein transglycosylase A